MDTPAYFKAPPTLLKLREGKGDTPTERFGRLLRERYAQIMSVYPLGSPAWHARIQGQDKELPTPTDSPEDYLATLRNSPDLEQELAAEYWTRVAELDKAHWHLEDGRTLRDYQKADISFTPWQLATGKPREYAMILNRNRGGSGKTNESGEAVLVAHRRQMREILAGRDPGLIVFCTSRATNMASQAFSKDQQVLRSPPRTPDKKFIPGYFRDLRAMFGEKFTKYFNSKLFHTLFDPASEQESGAVTLKCVLIEAGIWSEFQKEVGMKDVMTVLIMQLIKGDKILLKGIHKTPQPVDPPPLPKGAEHPKSYKGDATRGILEGAAVFATKPEWQLRPLEEDEKPLVMLAPISTFTASGAREKYEHHLQRTNVVVWDQAGSSSPEHIRRAVTEADGKRRPPVVFANNSVEVDRGNHAEWSRGGALSTLDLIRRRVFPNIGYDVFPGADKPLTQHGTEEAYLQLEEFHFEHSQMLQDLGLAQPWERDTVIIAPGGGDTVREYAHRLTLAYERLKDIHAEVFCFDGSAGNERELIELWFKHKGNAPKVLVASPSFMGDTADLPTLGNLTIAAAVNHFDRMGLFERTLHSLIHKIKTNKKGKTTERVLVREQLFAGNRDTLLRSTSEHGRELPEKKLSWPPHEVLFGEGYHEDEKWIASHTRRKISRLVPDALSTGEKHPKPKLAKVTPLEATSPFVKKQVEKRESNRAIREAKKALLKPSLAPSNAAQAKKTNDTPPPVHQGPIPYTARVLVGKEERTLTVLVNGEDIPTRGTIADIAARNDISDRLSALTVSVEWYHRDLGLRGNKLAEKILLRVIELQQIQAAELKSIKR